MSTAKGATAISLQKPSPAFDWNDVGRLAGYETPPPNAKTVSEYAPLVNKGNNRAYELLERAVKAGLLQSKKFVVNGTLTKYYWPIEGKT